MSGRSSINHLNTEILILIFLNLDHRSLAQCLAVSTRFNAVITTFDSTLWRPLIKSLSRPSIKCNCSSQTKVKVTTPQIRLDQTNLISMLSIPRSLSSIRSWKDACKLYHAWNDGPNFKYTSRKEKLKTGVELYPGPFPVAEVNWNERSHESVRNRVCWVVADYSCDKPSNFLPVRYSVNYGSKFCLVNFDVNEQQSCVVSAKIGDFADNEKQLSLLYANINVSDFTPFFGEDNSQVMFAHSSGIEMWSLSTLRQISFIPLSVSEIEAAYHGNFMLYTNRDLSYPLTLLDLSTQKIVWQKDIRPDISDILRLTNDGLDLISIFELSMNSFYFAIAAGFTIENPDIWVYTLSDPTLITHIPCDYSLFNQDESVLDVISIVQSLYLPSTPLLQDKLILNRGLRLDVYDIKRSTLKKAKKVFSLNTPFRKMTEKRRVRAMRDNEDASWVDTSVEIEGLNVANGHVENGTAASNESLDLNSGENSGAIENHSHPVLQANLNEDSTSLQTSDPHHSSQAQNQLMNNNSNNSPAHPHIIMDYKITPDNTSILASITNGFLVNYNIVERTTKVYKIPDGVGERQHKGVAVWWKTPEVCSMDADSEIENSAMVDIVEWVWID